MKRKYLSALLMGTLTVASMSTFTSCKDYDDDISNLQGQIDKLATADQLAQKVSELQALITSNQTGISSLQTKLAEVKAAADKAQTTADSKATLDQVNEILAGYATNENVTKEATEIVNAAIKALQDNDLAALKAEIKAAADKAQQGVDDAAAAKAEVLKTLEEYAKKSDVDAAVKDAYDKAIEAAKAGDATTLEAAKAEILKALKDYATTQDLKDVATAADKALKAAQTEQATKDEAAKKAADKALNDAVADLKAKITAAQAAAEDTAKKEAAKNAEAILALQNSTTASDALTKANANKAEIDKILNTLTGYTAQGTVKAAIDAITTQLNAKDTGLSGLNGRLAVVEAAINGGAEGSTEGLAAIISNIEQKLKDIIGQYSTMVTDVQLYAINGNWGSIGFDNHNLIFTQTVEKANKFPADAKAADKQLTFEEGKYYAGEDSLLVRVSPVDAELTANNVSLMNSQGKELNGLVDVTSVHRYNGLLSRAAATNSGLWVVKFKANDLGDSFKEAAMVDPTDNNSKKILYSVAVKNTYNTSDKKEDASTRRVTSEFEVALNTQDAKPAWDFNVNDKEVAYIHNRFRFTEAGNNTRDIPELVWKDDTKPATQVVTDNADATKINAVNRPTDRSFYKQDSRQGYSILPVVKGKPITIEFTNAAIKGVKGFYVTLDEKFAQESAPSELNAWNSYTYENVGYNGKPAKLFEGNKGTITIKDMNNVQGDVIGFRVYAVNYDGTLYDPDGRAFYVAVGAVKQEKTIEQTNVGIDMSTAANWNPQFVSEKIPVDFSSYDFDASRYYNWEVTEEDASGNKPTNFRVEYFDANGTEVSELSRDVKAIRFVLTDPGQFIDGAVYNVSTTLKKYIATAGTEVCTVNASFKKVMPTSAPTFGYRDGFDENTEFITPYDGNYQVGSSNKGGSFDFRNTLIINNNVNAWNGVDLFTEGTFIFNVANGTYNASGALDNASCTGSSYILNIQNGNDNLVDNKTKRKISAEFVYSRISKKYDTASENYVADQNWMAPSPTTKDIIYSTWSKNFAVATNGGEKWTGNGKKATEAGYIAPANVVEWTSAVGTATALDLSKVTVKVDKLSLLPVTTGVTGTTLDKFFASNVIAVVPGQYGEVYTTGKDGQINPYFTATINTAAKTVTLTQSNQATIPSTANKGEIHFTVKDCFGNPMYITLPFVIKMPTVATTAKKH